MRCHMKNHIKKISILFTFLFISNVFALNCDGEVTEILSGLPYCEGGERVGFQWTGGSDWLCSSNKNMDAF